MEAVAVAVTNQHITCVADVNAVWEVCDVLTANAAQELAIFIEDNHTVTLK